MNDLSTKISGDHYFNKSERISNSFDAKHYDEIITKLNLQTRHEYQFRMLQQEEELISQKRKRILLVDDEPDTCMVYQIVLEDAGYDASHIPILLKHWRNSDLIITAWLSSISKCLYLMDELCKKIREVDKTAKIIFITAGEGYY